MLNKKVIEGRIQQHHSSVAQSLLGNDLTSGKDNNDRNNLQNNPKVLMMVEQLKKSKRRKQMNTDKLAVKSRTRIEGWIQGQTNS